MECDFGKRTRAFKEGIKFIIDPEDYEKIKDKSFCLNNKGYARTSKSEYIHRIIMNCPEDKVVDHIDGNPLNNRRSNLRICTHQENIMNQKKHKRNTSGYKGVSFVKSRNKFQAKIMSNGKRIHLGLFDDPQKAYEKYCSEARKLHGEFFNSGQVVGN